MRWSEVKWSEVKWSEFVTLCVTIRWSQNLTRLDLVWWECCNLSGYYDKERKRWHYQILNPFFWNASYSRNPIWAHKPRRTIACLHRQTWHTCTSVCWHQKARMQSLPRRSVLVPLTKKEKKCFKSVVVGEVISKGQQWGLDQIFMHSKFVLGVFEWIK